MPLVRDQAVCLRVMPFSETSQIVSLFCREHGRVRLLAKGARRQTKTGKSQFDGGLDLLDAGDAVFSLNLDKDLSLLTEWRLRDSHSPLRQNLRALMLGLCAAELVDSLLEEHDAHPKLFDQLTRLLSRLADDHAREAVFLAFELNLLRQIGLLPDFSPRALSPDFTTASRFAFAPATSRLVSDDDIDQAGETLPVSRAGVEAVISLLRLARTGGGLPPVSREAADGANRMIAAHVRSLIGRPLRTARFVV